MCSQQVLQAPGPGLQLVCSDRFLLHSTGFIQTGQKARGSFGESQEGSRTESKGGEGKRKGEGKRAGKGAGAREGV